VTISSCPLFPVSCSLSPYDLLAQLGIRLGQQAQRARDSIVVGVLLLDDWVDIPAQVAPHQLVDQRDNSLRHGFAQQRPVRADYAVQLDLIQAAPQIALQWPFFNLPLRQPAGTHLSTQIFQNPGHINRGRVGGLVVVNHSNFHYA
jgi:hypothetical protein